MQIIRMPEHLEQDVRDLYEAGHPGWAQLPTDWYVANPTLIVIEPYPEHVVAYTSFAMNVADNGDIAIILQDTCVAFHARGRGYSRMLMQSRLDIGRSLGAKYAIGVTQPGNVAMLGLLRSMNFQEITKLPRHYKMAQPPQDGIMFMYFYPES